MRRDLVPIWCLCPYVKITFPLRIIFTDLEMAVTQIDCYRVLLGCVITLRPLETIDAFRLKA